MLKVAFKTIVCAFRTVTVTQYRLVLYPTIGMRTFHSLRSVFSDVDTTGEEALESSSERNG